MSRINIKILLGFLLAFGLLSGESRAAGERLDRKVISGGSVQSTAPSFSLSATVGQTAAGPSGSAAINVNYGFWQVFQMPSSFVCGDINNDGLVNILDIIFLIDFKFKGGPAPDNLEAADVNNDGLVNILDIIYLINHKFKGGPAPDCG